MDPTQVERRAELASTLNNMGWVIASTGRKNEARDVYRRGVALLEQCVADQPNVVSFRSNLAQILCSLGELLEGNDARAAFAKARALGEAIVAEVPTVPRYRSDLAMTLMLAGNLARNLKDYDEAVALQRAGRRPRRGIGTRPPRHGPVSARSGQQPHRISG